MEERHNLCLLKFPSIRKGKTSAASVAGSQAKRKREVRIRPFKSLDDLRKLSADGSDEEKKDPLEKLYPKLIRFGPTYATGTEPNKKAKDSAWQHIIRQEKNGKNGIESEYFRLIKEMEKEKEIFKCYDDTSFEKRLKGGQEFRSMMARDGCFFLQLSLHILGGSRHLGYPEQNPYFGKDMDSSSWIPHMFFVGNQIPYMVIEALRKQPHFQHVINQGKWKRPPSDDLPKLALYQMVVQPHLKKNTIHEPSSDILQTLRNLMLGYDSNISDPTYQEMREFEDLEANNDGKLMKFSSARLLRRRGIRVVKGKPGFSNLRFKDFGFAAYLYVPPLTVDEHTEELLTSLVKLEQQMKESERELTSYLRFMRDLSPTYQDFKILSPKKLFFDNKIICVKDNKVSEGTIVGMLDRIVSAHKSNYTINFRYTKQQITDYGGPPWRLISFCFGLLTVVQTVFTIISYCFPPAT